MTKLESSLARKTAALPISSMVLMRSIGEIGAATVEFFAKLGGERAGLVTRQPERIGRDLAALIYGKRTKPPRAPRNESLTTRAL